jgi:hypothetical protein
MIGGIMANPENMLKLVVCHTDDVDSEDAVKDLIQQSEAKLNGQIPDACILFAAIDYEHQVMLDEINSKWNGIKLIGGTTDGEMSSEMGFGEDSAVMMLFCSPKIKFTIGVGDQLSAGIQKACETAVKQAFDGLESDPKLCFTFPGNVTTNIDQIVSSLKSSFRGAIPIFGGVPGDQWRFETQYQFLGNQVFTDAVPILVLSGDFAFAYGVDSGWEPMGEMGIVNRAEANIVYEINNSPAIAFYKEGLGETSEPSGEFPIVILDENDQILYQRAVAQVLDDGSGAIAFLGEVPEGAKLSIARAEREIILEGATKSLQDAINNFPEDSEITGGLYFSCAARKALLGTRTEEEIKIARKMLGEQIPMTGFYSYGEICPLKNEPNNSMLHNQTFVTLLLGEGRG